MVKVRENLVGKRYGRLTVIKQAEDYITPSTQKHRAMWQCVCDCGNLVIASKYDLQRNSRPTVSCGCFSRESASERMHDITHKTNKYVIYDNYVVGYTSNTNEKFYLDIDDYDTIKDICWNTKVSKIDGFKQLCGYDYKNKRNVLFHNYIGFKNCDHIDRNELNNRKSNLRPCSNTENAQNKSMYKNNTSGITGVSWHNKNQKWVASIRINGKQTYIGSFISKRDAMIARLKAEKKYFGEFAPNKELYKKYNILGDSNETI